MRIIDKNTDFYDYLTAVYPDDSIVFDRRGSFLLTREQMCGYLDPDRWGFLQEHYALDPFRFVLLQVCNTFWLFLVTVTEFDKSDPTARDWKPLAFEAELLHTWKQYGRKRAFLTLDTIRFSFSVEYTSYYRNWKKRSFEKSRILEKIQTLVQAIDTQDYRVLRRICGDGAGPEEKNGTVKTEENKIPLLKASGLSECIDPLAIYLSFEEYFSLKKQDSERTASVGITDLEKIENHGFDRKTSFRGKNKPDTGENSGPK